MEKLELHIKKLEKIEKNCCLCKSKICGICPNNKNKKYLKKEIEKITGAGEKENFIKKIYKYIKN
ncbi:hypothetical protein FV113G1_13910 [Fusobacterium varium]|nr:hypothetical protein FV113G1_13910 [Fusobacterium varium]